MADTPDVTARYGDTFHPKYENWEEIKGDIEFRDVTFRYPDGEENVLEHFCLKVPHGQNIAIVGETGAGKSTLINLVCRFYEPTEGEILIDGRDVRERSQLWLLILDEATSSIDSLTEKKIQNAISAVTRDRTCFVIAHRLSTIVSADLILVVRDGKIIERGTHSELMAERGYYYSLYTIQHEKEIPVL